MIHFRALATAYGIFNLLRGLAMLVVSVLAGALWDSVGSQSTFLAGAAFTAIALAGLLQSGVLHPPSAKARKSD